MRKAILSLGFWVLGLALLAQDYPNPEFTNEVYGFRKDSSKLTRLEKQTSDLTTKSLLGGMGGYQSFYLLDGGRAPLRINDMTNRSFLYWTGETTSLSTNAKSDSLFHANGLDPNAFSALGQDPAKNIVLYKTETEKSSRKVILMGGGGVAAKFSKKKTGSEKYSLSFKKVKAGLYEIVVDKTLPPGEYAFMIPLMGYGASRNGASFYCFGVD